MRDSGPFQLPFVSETKYVRGALHSIEDPGTESTALSGDLKEDELATVVHVNNSVVDDSVSAPILDSSIIDPSGSAINVQSSFIDDREPEPGSQSTSGGEISVADHEDESKTITIVVKDDAKAVQEMLDRDMLVVFAKSWCPFCTEVKRTLDESKAKYAYYSMDEMDNGGDLHADLKKRTGQTSVPYVFQNGVLLGGCDDFKSGIYSGKVPTNRMPDTAAVADTASPDRFPQPFFLFAGTVDNRAVRVIGCVTCFISVLAGVLGLFDRTVDAAKWITVGLFVDFLLRFVGGGRAAPVGAFSIAAVGVGQRYTGSRAKWQSGFAKQFAVFIGIIFSGVAALLFILAEFYGKGYRYAAAALMLGLCGAAFLQGFMNFCIACNIFAIASQLGFIIPTINSLHINAKPDMTFAWNEANTVLDEGKPASDRTVFPQRPGKTKVDQPWLEKTDAMRREDASFVRHFKSNFWGMPLSLAALAFVFRQAHESHQAVSTRKYSPNVGDIPWKVLALMSAAIWTLFAVLQITRAICYWKKVNKELKDPMKSNAFLFMTITPLVWVHFALDISTPLLAKIMFWLAAPLQTVLCLYVLSQWFYYLRDKEHVSVVWLAVPLCNVFSALAWESLWPSEGNLASGSQLWMGFAVLLFVALFPLAVYKVILGHNLDTESRSLQWLITAAPAVLGVGWQIVNSPDELSPVFTSFYFGSLLLALALVYGIYPMRHFFAAPWNMGEWAAAFSCSALAIATITFNNFTQTQLTEVMAIVAICIASYANWECLGHFTRDLFIDKLFVPAKASTPAMFTKLTHEAFRGMFPKIKGALAAAVRQEVGAIAVLLHLWEEYMFLHRVHMMHEEDILFATADEYYPHHSDIFVKEHEADHVLVAAIQPTMDRLKDVESSAEAATMLSTVEASVLQELENFAAHLRHEENVLSPVVRKHNSVAKLKISLREIWNATDALDMFRFIPLVVTSIQRHPQRVMFVRTLLWAMPYRAHQIGMMIALRVDPIMWQRLVDDLPDIAPRGMRGYKRFG